MGKSTINKTKKQAYKSVCASLSMCVNVCSYRKRSAAVGVAAAASAAASASASAAVDSG